MPKSVNLPESWIWSTFGETFDIYVGATPSRKNLDYWGGNIPWVSSGEVAFCEIDKTRETITELGLKNTSTELHPPGTVLLGMIGEGKTRGQAAILKISATHNQNSAAIRVSEAGLPSKYVYYFFKLEYNRTRQIGSGNNQPALNKTRVQLMQFPLPPLNEQRRIVAKIEALKARSQRVKDALEDIPQLLDQFRQSVLAAAFRGDLTADWREQNSNVEPASVLLEKIQQRIVKSNSRKDGEELPDPFEIPHRWKWVQLSDICVSITDGDHQAPPKANIGIPFIVISNISKGKLDFTNIRYVPKEYYNSLQYHRKPKKGDILYSVVGSYGIPVLIDTEEIFCFQRHIALLRPTDLLISQYLLYVLQSNFVLDQATKVATGTTQLTVTLTGLRKIKVPLIPFNEQQEIINIIKIFFKTIDDVEKQYQQVKANLEQLDKSILTKAFRGELVPQDLNDEPASVLLERIRAERAKLETKIAKKSTAKTSTQSTKKTQVQVEESVQLELGLE